MKYATSRGHIVAAFLSQVSAAILSFYLSVLLKCGLTVGQTCSMEMEQGRIVGEHGGSNGA